MDERPDQVEREDRPNEEVRDRLSRRRGEIDSDPSRADDELEELRLELAQARAQMSETVYALQGRLNPQYVREQATSQAKDTAREAGSSVVDTIRDNPVPAALTGAGVVGLGWLIASGRDQGSDRRGSRNERYRSESYYDEYPEYYEGRREIKGHSTVGTPEDYGSGESSSGAGRFREAGSEARERASRMGSELQSRADEAGGQLQDRAGEARDQARRQARRARGGFQQTLRDNPLILGAVALGLGAAVGFSVPETQKENEVMGETRDKLANRAQQGARDAQQRAQRVAEEARSAAEEEASNQDPRDQGEQ